MYPYRTRRSSSGNVGLWVAAAVVVVGLIVIGAFVAKAYGTHHEVTTTVSSKERVCSGNNDCKYLLFTGHGTYRITDAFLVGTTRFNSSDVYGKIHPCHSYRITYYGWRLPISSSYPNVVRADDLGRDRSCTPD